MKIEKTTFDFLKALAKNNNRPWFQQNKQWYLDSHQNMISWVDALIDRMNQHDQLETKTGKESLYRIYNDVRFSTDKTPYQPRFAGHLKRMKPWLRGGYYFWVRPGATRIGCGFTYPNATDLLRIRKDIELNSSEWRKLLRASSLRTTFGQMTGEQLATAPRNFTKDHPAIDLLRYKQFWFEASFSDRDAMSPDFLKTVNRSFTKIRPFFNYMSDVLTTDLNGEPLPLS